MTDQAVVRDGDDAVAAEVESIKTAASEARAKYEKVMGLYEDFAKSIESVLSSCIEAEGVMAYSITSRAKLRNLRAKGCSTFTGQSSCS